jgi:tRNA(Arg) A34 adenosine deaminase TadA
MHRRNLLKGGTALVAVAVAAGTGARAKPGPVLPDDARFMQLAIDEAKRADFPFGAVIVKDGKVLARGHNRTHSDRDPTAHGEIVAIRAFAAAHGPEALKGTTLYTSGEPCCMCMGAIIWSGIGRLVFAASIEQLATKIGQIMLTAEEVAQKAPFASIEIAGSVLAQDAMRLFR